MHFKFRRMLYSSSLMKGNVFLSACVVEFAEAMSTEREHFLTKPSKADFIYLWGQTFFKTLTSDD